MAMTEAPSRRRLLTIGTVCNRLQDEFPDVSISKIRYLEDQGLLNPRRTQGGYRLFSRGRRRAAGDDSPPAAGRVPAAARDPARSSKRARASSAGGGAASVDAGEDELDLEELCERAGITTARARELEEFGLLEPRVEDGQRIYAESEADIAAACEALARFGIDAAEPARLPHRSRPREQPARGGDRSRPALAERRSAGRPRSATCSSSRRAPQELADLLLRRNVRRLVE